MMDDTLLSYVPTGQVALKPQSLARPPCSSYVGWLMLAADWAGCAVSLLLRYSHTISVPTDDTYPTQSCTD